MIPAPTRSPVLGPEDQEGRMKDRVSAVLLAALATALVATAQEASPLKYSLDGATWVTVREAYFPPGTKVQIGVMAAAPEGRGFPVHFDGFSVTTLAP
jgi:regulation of enolase protein 1 (concanavalin A-like superfamily)